MELLKLYIFTDAEQENGIGVKILGKWDATKGEKTYSMKGTRIPIEYLDMPLKDVHNSESKLFYTIWTTEENAKKSILKCVEKILEDFKDREVKWNLVKDAVAKIESKLMKP